MFYPRRFRAIMPVISLALLLSIFAPHASAQDATPPPAETVDSASLTAALASADPPITLPGNANDEVELVTWEEYYGEALENVQGAWLLNGSLEFPLATIIVFNSSEDSQQGIEGYAQEEPPFTVNGLDAWTIADRGKWVCITATGPMVVMGQALPVDTDEPEEVVEERSCAVLEATLTWLNDDVIAAPSASPTTEPAT